MDEVSALCHRVAVLRAGKLRFAESPQKLKAKHGGGYRISLTRPPPSPPPASPRPPRDSGDTETAAAEEELEARVRDALPGALPERGRRGATSHWRATLPQASLGDSVRSLEALRASGAIASYALEQPSLESAFIAVISGRRRRVGSGDGSDDDDDGGDIDHDDGGGGGSGDGGSGGGGADGGVNADAELV